MDSFIRFQEYKKTKQRLKCNFKGVNLVEAAAVELLDIMVVDARKSLYDVFAAMCKRVDVKPLLQCFKESDIVCSYNFPKRRDHLSLAQMITSSIEKSTLHTLTYKKRLTFNVIRFAKFLSKIDIKTTLMNKLFLAAIYTNYSHVVDELEKYCRSIPLSDKKYIPFLSSAYSEALLTLFLKGKHVKTFQLIHGAICDYKKTIPIDVINWDNITADYILCWSDFQKRFFQEKTLLPDSHILIAGNPKYPYKKICVQGNMSKFVILGGTKAYDNDFIELLSIVEEVAQENGIVFQLKPHPNSEILNHPKWKQFSRIKVVDKTTTVKELFESGDFDCAITFNTTTYYECMYYGIVPLRWGVNENLDIQGLNDHFFDKQSFMDLIEKYQGMDKSQLSSDMESILINEIGMGINNYNAIVNDL